MSMAFPCLFLYLATSESPPTAPPSSSLLSRIASRLKRNQLQCILALKNVWSTFRSFVWQAYATFCLFQVFTKCKGSLQNGRRLENITWRLWHRELKAVEGEGSLSLPADSLLEIIMFRLLCLVSLPTNLQYRALQASEILV